MSTTPLEDTISREMPFTQIPDWIGQHPKVTHACFRVYWAICHRVGKARTAYPSIATIATDAHCSTSTVTTSIEILQSIGAMVVTPRKSKDGKSVISNHYYLPMAAPIATNAPPPRDERDTPLRDEREQTTSISLTPSTEPKIAKRDEWWDTLTDLLGKPTPQQTSLQGRLVHRVRTDGHPPQEILVRAERLASMWGPAKLTLASLEKHWERMGVPLAGITKQQMVDNQRQRELAEAMRSLE